MTTYGLGCMRLSTAPDRDDARAIAVIDAALRAGATWLDTSNAYAHDDRDVGHNERLIARALAGWDGDRDTVRVVTKGGLTRPRGQWVPDGRAKALRTAAAASAERLGRIDMYLLHAIDPRTRLETSARALARILKDGHCRAVGLSNVNVSQIEAARAVVPVAAVEVELGPWQLDPVRNGVLEHCRDHGIALLAHRPLGGPRGVARLEKDPVLAGLADQAGVPVVALALAWVASLGVVPLPGCTRVETARALEEVGPLEGAVRDAMDRHLWGHPGLRLPRRARQPARSAEGDIVVVMGGPGAGKTTVAEGLEAQGYLRINRDQRGGRLSDLPAVLETALDDGTTRVVLDNTYASRARRNEILETAWRHGHGVRCIHVDTPLPLAQVNAVRRMLARHGRLLDADALKEVKEPGAYLPRVQHRYHAEMEPPTEAEGFASVTTVCPELSWTGDAGLVVDATRLTPERLAALAGRRAAGFAWGRPPELGALPIRWCPHGPGPPRCWCRPPLPGLVVQLVLEHGLDPRRSTLVGHGAAHVGLAERLGMRFAEADAFFA